MRALLSGLSALALAALLSRPAGALEIPAPAAPSGPVAAGALVTTRVPALTAGARELELFMLPESGPAIRLSPELPAGTSEVTWRMPRIAARQARLVLRVGSERSEWVSPSSAPFAVAPLPASELAEVLRARSEAGYRLERLPAPLVGLCESPGRSELVARRGAGLAVEGPGAPALEVPRRGAEPAPKTSAFPSPCAARTPRPLTPAFTPLRN